MDDKQLNDKDNKIISNIKEVLNVLKEPSNKEALKFLRSSLRIFYPNPLLKLLYDIVIIIILVFLVLYCADHKYIDPQNVQSLLTLIVGAIIGSRFKSN